MRPRFAAILFVLTPFAACTSAEGTTDGWSGTMDTLPSGQVVVRNTDEPIWPPGEGWRVVEETRIGTIEGDGPDLFGRIISLGMDPLGRVWILEGQAQELRVFEEDGSFVRTIGRSGGGPGEFSMPMHLQLGPDGVMWVVDPQNNRVSRFDTAGTYIDGRHSPGGFGILPWPGGFDDAGRYYSPVPLPSEEFFALGLVRYDTAFTPIDTLTPPRDPVERDRFELREEGGRRMQASIPYDAGFRWHVAPSGTIWAMLTGEYRLVQLSSTGDTLRSLTRTFDRLPVTDEDLDAAREQLEWFTSQGGRVDLGKIPSHKPATEDFFFDDAGHLWVRPVVEAEREDRVFHVFDLEGRYLGEIELPFALASPYPVFRDTRMYAVTRDELDVPYLVVARIEKP